MPNIHIESKNLKQIPDGEREKIFGLTKDIFAKLNHGAEFALSKNEQMALAMMVYALLGQNSLHIVAPLCPDYSLENGKYTFCGLGNGIGRSAEKVAESVGKVKETIENTLGGPVRLKFTGYYADLEAFDDVYPRAVGITSGEFLELVRESSVEGQNFFERTLNSGSEIKIKTMYGSGLVTPNDFNFGEKYATSYKNAANLVYARSEIYGSLLARIGENLYKNNELGEPRVGADLARLGSFASALKREQQQHVLQNNYGFMVIESMSAMPVSVYNKEVTIPIYRGKK